MIEGPEKIAENKGSGIDDTKKTPTLEDIIREELLKNKAKMKDSTQTDSFGIHEERQDNDLKEERKDAANLHSSTKEVVKCWSCLQTKGNLQKCSRCRKARYCGEICQLKHWEFHKDWCKEKAEKRERRKRKKGELERINSADEVD